MEEGSLFKRVNIHVRIHVHLFATHENLLSRLASQDAAALASKSKYQ